MVTRPLSSLCDITRQKLLVIRVADVSESRASTDELVTRNPACRLEEISVGAHLLKYSDDILRRVKRLRGRFDQVVIDHPLEWLEDLNAYFSALRRVAHNDSSIVVCSRNNNHWGNYRRLLLGEDAQPGVSLNKVNASLQASGWNLIKVKPVPLSEKPPNKEQLEHLKALTKSLSAASSRSELELTTEAWIISAHAGSRRPLLHVVGLGLPKKAGVTEARIDHPLAALASMPHVRATWGAGRIQIPKSYKPGILILHRQFMNNPKLNEQIEALIQKGWLVVADMDDDPYHWQAYVTSDFYAFRAVHAVTVSTVGLKTMMLKWNPNVEVLPNALLALPKTRVTKSMSTPLRVFFGAINRTDEWREILNGMAPYADSLKDLIHFVIVHDRKAFDLIPEGFSSEFHPTLDHERYLAVMQTCDLAILPLFDTPFNRLKSNLKLIESCACGAVPLFSPTVYGETPAHKKVGFQVDELEGWGEMLLRLAKDLSQIEKKRKAGYDYVKRQGMQAQAVKKRYAFYEQIWLNREQLEVERQIRLREMVGRVGLEPTTKGL